MIRMRLRSSGHASAILPELREGGEAMTDREKAARAIGYLEGFSCIVWTFVGEKLADDSAAAYDAAVETLRKAVFKQEGDEK